MISTSMWTRPELEQHLRDLGLQTGETLIVHSSLKSIGWVVGGARTVIDALFAVLGPEGTLVMPAQSGENSDPANWSEPPVPRDWWPRIREHTPAFNPAITPLRRIYCRIGFLDQGDWMMAEHLKGHIERQEGHVLQL